MHRRSEHLLGERQSHDGRSVSPAALPLRPAGGRSSCRVRVPRPTRLGVLAPTGRVHPAEQTGRDRLDRLVNQIERGGRGSDGADRTRRFSVSSRTPEWPSACAPRRGEIRRCPQRSTRRAGAASPSAGRAPRIEPAARSAPSHARSGRCLSDAPLGFAEGARIRECVDAAAGASSLALGSSLAGLARIASGSGAPSGSDPAVSAPRASAASGQRASHDGAAHRCHGAAPALHGVGQLRVR